MVSVELIKDRQGRIAGFRCLGHAGYSEQGSDIVCAAISALTHTTVLAIHQLLKLPGLKVRTDEQTGLLECSWRNEPNNLEKSDLTIRVMLLGLAEIQKQYPEHLKVSEVEVNVTI